MSDIRLVACISIFISCAHLFVADMLRTIRDPEKPSTLEDLNVVYEEGIFIQKPTSDNVTVVCMIGWLELTFQLD